MANHDDLVGEILSSSGIPTRRQRADLERELRAHVEDMQEQGDVLSRFGNPADISSAFFRVYRTQRGMIAAAICAAYNIVSFAVVFVVFWSLMLFVDVLDAPLNMQEVRAEAVWSAGGLALLSVSYGWLFFGERLFNKHAFAKSASPLLVLLACGGIEAWLVPSLRDGVGLIGVAVLVAIIFRALEVRGVRFAWLAGPLLPISAIWLATGPPFPGGTRVNDPAMSSLVIALLAVCCLLVSLCARGLDRLGSTV